MTTTLRGATTLRWLLAAAVLEALTLVALLANLATVHDDAVASALGPVHGTAYLAAIALAWSFSLARDARLLAFVPGIGGLLAHRAARRTDQPASVSGRGRSRDG